MSTSEPAPAAVPGPPAARATGGRSSLPPPSQGLLRHPDFLRLWTGETISQLGTQVSALAIPFVAIEILQASTFEVALLNVVDFLPFLLIGLPAGVWVDRLRRRPVMIVGDLGRALALATIPLAFLAGALTLVQLYAVGLIVGMLTVFFDVAYQSYLPSLVARDQLQEGNAKLEISRAAAQVIGPGLAGVLIGVLRAPLAVAVDSVSFLGSALFLFLIRRPEPAPAAPNAATGDGATGEPRPGMRREMAEGLRYVVGHADLRSIAACTATANLFGNVTGAVLLVYAVRELGMSAESIGLALSIGATGALLGALLSNRLSARLGVGPTIVVSAAIAGPAMLPFALAPVGTPTPVLVALAALAGFVGGVSVVVYNVAQVSLRQAVTPTRMQGRMNATMRWFVWGTIPIGAVLGGVIGSLVGVREAVLIGALGELAAILPVLLGPVRHIREMPAPVEEVEPEPAARGVPAA
ncbi:MAG: MFS transporter [Chloroflexi bacterium]|nr:MFS transporter [Chloroflexota bacterium]